jgi:hypothetical protein
LFDKWRSRFTRSFLPSIFPFIILWVSSSSCLNMWPIMFHGLVLMALNNLSLFIYFIEYVFVGTVFYPSILLQLYISKLPNVRCSILFTIHVSQPLSVTLQTYSIMKRLLILILILLEHNNFFSFINSDFACAILNLISMIYLPSWLIYCQGIYNVPLVQAASSLFVH